MTPFWPMFPSWAWILGFVFGAAVGSFLNVVIYRLPRGLSLGNPSHSFCPNCKHQLGVADLFPLFSFLLSRGKCRHCGQKVASRYFWVELITGSLWALIWQQYMYATYEPLKAAFYALTCAALVAIIFIDWELYIIPDELNAVLLVFAVAYHALDKTLGVALSGALLGWGILWGIAFIGRLMFGKDAMGHGDIKMMRGVGALLGPLLLAANMGIAVVAGLVIGLALIGLTYRSRKADSESSPEADGDEEYEVESIGSLLIHGLWYLACLDIVAIFVPSMYKWIGEDQTEELIEDDDWKPSLTTIPFGPYLAIGAIVCMTFSAKIESAIASYWRNATHATASVKPRTGRIAGTWVNGLNYPAAFRVDLNQGTPRIAYIDPPMRAERENWTKT